ncbi:hypothetical protein Y032_0120g944 [Ancylostoma ceylanicum]|uniref:Uncharacterized protein n=1 Tax=Ancylostoma ceylanicum TaxID=53326 RepID=A0A016TAS9_9BILA|nr:hypothetical protein Y032_0120g944 [Ancylostoma ceylanicum]
MILTVGSRGTHEIHETPLFSTIYSPSHGIFSQTDACEFQANKNAKRVIMEHQAQPSKDQQVATMGYNPYAYWPYYGRA